MRGILAVAYGNILKNCLVHGMFEFVDDADVRRPGDNERHVEVDDAGDHRIDGDPYWVASKKSWSDDVIGTYVREHEDRDIERHVVDPYVEDNTRSHVDFESRSTHLVQS